MADSTATDRYVADNHDGTWLVRCRECDEHARDFATYITDTLGHDEWHDQVADKANIVERHVAIRYWRCPACGKELQLGRGQTAEYTQLEQRIVEEVNRRDWHENKSSLLTIVYEHRRYGGCWSRVGVEDRFAFDHFDRDAAIASEKPVPTAVYRHFDENGTLLYIGCSSDPDNRAQSHKRGAVWSLWASDQSVEWYASRLEGEEAERQAIETDGPIFNVTHNDGGHRRRQVEYLISRGRFDLLSPATKLTHLSSAEWLAALNLAKS